MVGIGPVSSHEPVLINEMVRALKPRDGAEYVDGTFGAGNYSRAILNAADCRVWAIDRDPKAVSDAKNMVEEFAGRLAVIENRFGNMVQILNAQGVKTVDGIALDLGVSSMQLDDADRGFSFRQDGPLDMRQAKNGPSAADVVNETEEKILADIIFKYGEERQAHRIAHAIVAARANRPLTRTGELANIVRDIYRGRPHTKTDPATKTFQAIRIYVNDELGELRRGLSAAEVLLAPGGVLAVVSFHSLEDRITKRFFRVRAANRPAISRHLPSLDDHETAPSFRLLQRRAIKPSREEQQRNHRSRSARLRVGERTSEPPFALQAAKS
ncbi:MAG: 16S rRNA (cytosine(1402)-N(4))-methyltransferase [Alphaproteobacteria bacterium]|nr:16S rRNA (cytosine(1402)-N(4))-methyltransferase [Alphaproteobacteria bacterium]